jgi:hypothetical protein
MVKQARMMAVPGEVTPGQDLKILGEREVATKNLGKLRQI